MFGSTVRGNAVAKMAQERRRLYATAYSGISERHIQHRARFLALWRRHNLAITYEFQRGDYVRINNQKVASLTPTYLGPFKLTDNGNAII